MIPAVLTTDDGDIILTGNGLETFRELFTAVRRSENRLLCRILLRKYFAFLAFIANCHEFSFDVFVFFVFNY